MGVRLAGDAEEARRNGEARPAATLKMPASPERAARDIAAAGVEGRPADATAGPKQLRLEMLGLGVGLLLVSVVVGIWVSWVVGGLMLVVGGLALVFNPVMGATALRSEERRDVAEMEQGRQANSSEGSRP